MSGSGGGSGYDFQSEVFAFVSAHVLSGQRLDWFEGVADVPLAISMESDGPGDDLRIELERGGIIELQAKKGLSRGQEFNDTMVSLGRGLAEDENLLAMLLVDTSTSGPIQHVIRKDFLRLSDGRSDNLKVETKKLLKTLSDEDVSNLEIFRRLRIVPKDLSQSGDGKRVALELLSRITTNPTEAWSVLSKRGMELIGRKGRSDLVSLRTLLGLDKFDELANDSSIAEFRKWTLETNAKFAVVALSSVLPIEVAWSQMRWFESKEKDTPSSSNSLADSLTDYHEWARLADNRKAEETPIKEFLHGSNLVVIGGPGSAKSTLLKKIAFCETTEGKLVAKVSLRLVSRLISRGSSFCEAVATVASDCSPISENQMTRILPTLDLLLADGLDETDPERLLIAEALEQWAKAHPTVKVVVTTRPIGHEPSILRSFDQAELLPLSSSAVEEVADALLASAKIVEEKKREIMSPFRQRIGFSQETTTAARLAMRNPLLLTFLVRLALDGDTLDGHRPYLFRRIIDLIYRASSSNRHHLSQVPQTAAWCYLRALSWKTQLDPGCGIRDLRNFISQEFGKISSQDILELDKMVLEAEKFWESRGLVEKIRVGGESTLTVIHLSLSEYLAAEFLQQMPAKPMEEWLECHRRDTKWYDTIALACGAGSLESIVDRLLQFDNPSNPCSSESNLCLAGIAETENPPSQVVDRVLRVTATRLDSPIPLFSVEAAKRVVVIASLLGKFVERIAADRLDHEQAWTRLGAFAILLEAKSSLVTIELVRSWLGDERLEPGSRLFLQTGNQDIPSEAYDLRRMVLERSFEFLFLKNPQEAERIADALLEKRRIPIGFIDSLIKLLKKHECFDLVEKFETHWGLHKLKGLNLGNSLSDFTRDFLLTLLLAVREKPAPKQNNALRKVPLVKKMAEVFQFWDMPLDEISYFSDLEEINSSREVISSMLILLGIQPQDLVSEINHLLSLESPDSALHEKRGSAEIKKEPDWNLSPNLAVNVKRLVAAFAHPSQIVNILAAQLVDCGAGGQDAAEELKEHLSISSGTGLLPTATVGSRLWGDDAEDLLISRFEKEPHDGIQHICSALGGLDDRPKAREFLLRVLTHSNFKVAHAAAEALTELKAESTSGYIKRLREAFDHWDMNTFNSDCCDVPVLDGSCPKCKCVKNSPVEPLVHELSRVGFFSVQTLIEFVVTQRQRLVSPATSELVEKLIKDPEAFKDLAEDWMNTGKTLGVLQKVFREKPGRLKNISSDITDLRHSKSAAVRNATISFFAELIHPTEELLEFSIAALDDPDPRVRNAAAQSARTLSSKRS